mmetsp:Transcript_13359/g.40498  ORF Transcript_13359/g.40498 Transcript_13359/m.40498 type:complete len:200 (-) Transcript_13359:630-1229(-)
MAAIRRIGFRWLHNDVRLDLLGNRTDPLGDRYLGRSDVRHVGNHRELLRPRRENHLSHAAGAPLALLRLVRIGRGVHRSHGHLEEIGVAIWRLDRRAEELEPTHVSSTLDLDALLAALLHHLGDELGPILSRLFLGGWLRLLLGLGRLLLFLLLPFFLGRLLLAALFGLGGALFGLRGSLVGTLFGLGRRGCGGSGLQK